MRLSFRIAAVFSRERPARNASAESARPSSCSTPEIAAQKATTTSAAIESGSTRARPMKIPAPAAPRIAPTSGKKIADSPGGAGFPPIGKMVKNEIAPRTRRISIAPRARGVAVPAGDAALFRISFDAKGLAEHHPVNFLRHRRRALVQNPRVIPKITAHGVIGNEPAADLVGDENHRRPAFPRGADQFFRVAIYIAPEGEHHVGQPQR